VLKITPLILPVFDLMSLSNLGMILPGDRC